eukprot:6671960-Pyramimonas_sp.AAC.1
MRLDRICIVPSSCDPSGGGSALGGPGTVGSGAAPAGCVRTSPRGVWIFWGAGRSAATEAAAHAP